MERCRRQLENCPARLSKHGCGVIMHHIFWPRSAYEAAGEIAEEFRDLKENQVPMCKGEEMLLHQGDPPPMPTMEVMEHVVETQRLRRELAARPIHKP